MICPSAAFLSDPLMTRSVGMASPAASPVASSNNTITPSFVKPRSKVKTGRKTVSVAITEISESNVVVTWPEIVVSPNASTNPSLTRSKMSKCKSSA